MWASTNCVDPCAPEQVRLAQQGNREPGASRGLRAVRTYTIWMGFLGRLSSLASKRQMLSETLKIALTFDLCGRDTAIWEIAEQLLGKGELIEPTLGAPWRKDRTAGQQSDRVRGVICNLPVSSRSIHKQSAFACEF